MAEATIIKVCECAQCGVQFEAERKRKYCSQRCMWQAASRRKGKRPIDEVRAEQRARTHRECPECRRTFRITRHDRHSKGPQVYCSPECRHAEGRRQALIAREAAIYRAWSAAAKRRERLAQVRKCRDCDSDAPRFKTYCEPCRLKREHDNVMRWRKSQAARAAKAVSKVIRRHRLAAASIERFDPFEVFERDGWRCHLCGCKTPKRLRGSTDDRAPELDHIIPLAAGGEHSRRNTACACRKCNGAKGALPFGQLRLIA